MTRFDTALNSKLNELMELLEQDRDFLVAKGLKKLEVKDLGEGDVAPALPTLVEQPTKLFSLSDEWQRKLTRQPLTRLVQEEGITEVKKERLTFKTSRVFQVRVYFNIFCHVQYKFILSSQV